MTPPTDDKLREQIKTMLDNTILDWNRPSQLTAINADTNYDKLIPAIMQLIATERQQLKDYNAKVVENISLCALAKIPSHYTDPVSGEKLYNQAHIEHIRERVLRIVSSAYPADKPLPSHDIHKLVELTVAIEAIFVSDAMVNDMELKDD